VLPDHREQVAEELAVLVGERLGDLVDRRGARLRMLVGADPGMPAAVEPRLGRLGLL
jgi:hypothetical protein